MVISKIKMLGTFGFTAAAVGGLVYQYRNSSGPPAELESSSELQQRVLDLLEEIQRLQISEQTAHERAAAAEVSNQQLAQEAQELQDSRGAAVALHQQLEQALQQSRHLAEAVREEASSRADSAENATQDIQHKREKQDSLLGRKHSVTAHPSHLAIQGRVRRAELEQDKVAHNAAELRTSFTQAQLSHTIVVKRIRQQLQNAVERHTASQGRLEGQLAAEKQAHCAVSKDLVAAQREMEGLIWRNQELELELANAAMGGQAHQVQVEQQELRASWEAQSAELASVKVELTARDADIASLREQVDHLQSQLQASNGQLQDAREAEEAHLERMRRDGEQHAADMAAIKAQVERMGRDASDAAHLQQLQAKERLLGDMIDANKQLQEELGAQAAEKQQAMCGLQEQVDCLQDQVAQAQNACSPAQEESQQLLQRAELAEGQVHHLQGVNLSLFTKLADAQQQLPALQSQLQSAAEGKQFATAIAERLGGQVETLQGEVAELQRQLDQQSSQLSSRAADSAELADTQLKLLHSQVGCKVLEKAQGRAEGLRQQLQAAVAAQQLVEGNLVKTTTKLAASDKMLKLIGNKRETGSRRKSELKKQKSDLEARAGGLNEKLQTALTQLEAGLQEEIAQGCHLANHVDVLKAQLVSAGLEPASADDDDDDDDYDALSLSDLDLTVRYGGQDDEEATTPQSWGSTLGSPHIGAVWGNLDVGASCSSDFTQSLQMHNEDASRMDDAARSPGAGSSVYASSSADASEGGDRGFNSKEDGWEKVQRKMRKEKASWDGLRQGSRGNARRSGNREKSRLGNPANV